MSDKSGAGRFTPGTKKNVPVALDAGLDQLVTETARRLKLSKQDTMRLSMERGLPVLIRQLTSEPPPAPEPEPPLPLEFTH